MLEKRTSGGGVCVGGVAAYGRSQPADSTQHTTHSSGVDVDEVVDRSGGDRVGPALGSSSVGLGRNGRETDAAWRFSNRFGRTRSQTTREGVQ